MVLTLSNEKVGVPKGPMSWNNAQQKLIPIPYKENFIEQIQKSVVGKVDKDPKELRLYCKDTLGDAQHYHLNYLNYLQKCWADHLGIVITPDIIWYTLLSELTIIIKKQPETFRHLFSKSYKTEKIIIFSANPVEMPLNILTDALKNKVPMDIENFFPEFSTRTPKSFHAFQAAFCDMCSPYYDYFMYLCNIPKVDVRGTLDDWKNLSNKWNKLSKTVFESAWTVKVSAILKDLVDNFQDGGFWKKIFHIKHCGSGGQIEVSGWFTEFFKDQPKVRYVENYSPHISVVKYKQKPFDQNFEMSVGLFSSKKEDEFMVPDFSFVINEIL